MTFETYVIKYKNTYLRFGSYGKATKVDSPLKATMYSTKNLAQRRLEQNRAFNNSRRVWIDGSVASQKDLRISKLTFRLESES